MSSRQILAQMRATTAKRLVWHRELRENIHYAISFGCKIQGLVAAKRGTQTFTDLSKALRPGHAGNWALPGPRQSKDLRFQRLWVFSLWFASSVLEWNRFANGSRSPGVKIPGNGAARRPDLAIRPLWGRV